MMEYGDNAAPSRQRKTKWRVSAYKAGNTPCVFLSTQNLINACDHGVCHDDASAVWGHDARGHHADAGDGVVVASLP